MRQLKIGLLAAALGFLPVMGGCSSVVKDTEKEKTVEKSEAQDTEKKKKEDVSEVPDVSDSVVVTDTFEVDVPDGWVVARQGEDSVKLVKAADADAYDSFKDASLEIAVSAYQHKSAEDLDKQVENDKQFFENGDPSIQDVVFIDSAYQGKLLSGPSFAYKGCTFEYYILDAAADGTDLRSRMKVQMAYYDDAQKAEEEAILDSLKVTAEAPEAEVSADSGQVIEKDYYTLTVPEGWSVKRDSVNVDLENAKFGGGYVTIGFGFKDAKSLMEDKDANYGGGHEIWEKEIDGRTWYGMTVSDSTEIMATDASDGKSVSISTMRVQLDQVPEIVEAISVK